MNLPKSRVLILIMGALVVVIVIIITYLITVQIATSKLVKISSPKLRSVANLNLVSLKVNFKTKDKNIPSLATYKVSSYGITREQALKIAGSFGFSNQPITKGDLAWKEGNRSLTIKLSPLLIKFRDSGVQANGQIANSQELVRQGQTFLKSKGLWKSDLLVNRATINTLDKLNHSLNDIEDPNKKKLVEINFDRKINGLAVFSPVATQPTVTIIINSQGQVFKLFYQYREIHEEANKYPIIPSENIKANLVRTQGIWVYPSLDSAIFSPELIRDVEIEDYTLVYLDDTASGFLQPIYLLRGIGLAGKEKTDVVIYQPAISGKWYK